MNNNSILYQIFLRSFTPEGTLKGAEKMLPHIASLGFDIVYLCPICEADDDTDPAFWSPRHKESKIPNPKNPYRIKDYFKIDEEYGNEEDLHSFVKKAHSLGLKVLLDLVYLHCGPKAVFLKDHPEFASHDENGNVINGPWLFPALNIELPELREYLYSNMEYYIREFNVDGYRCDTAEYLPLDFWAEGKKRIKALNPDVILIDEGDSPEFVEDVFDAQYIFKWSSTLRKVFQQEVPASSFVEIIKEEEAKLPSNALGLRFVDNHDKANDAMYDRFEKLAGHDLAEASLVLNFTFTGILFVYNGNEICDTERHSIWGNRFYAPEFCINWSRALTPEGQRRMTVVKQLTTLRKNCPVLTEGSVEWLTVGDADHILAFARKLGDRTIIVIVNTALIALESTVDVSIPENAKIVVENGFVITLSNEQTCFAAKAGGYTVIEF